MNNLNRKNEKVITMKNKTTPKKESKNVTTFTMRMNRGIKKALEEAARQDRRSLASLLEK